MTRRVLRILGKIGLSALCILIPVVINYICRAQGIILGGIPTAIIYLPVFGLLYRVWKKKPSPPHKAPPEVVTDSVLYDTAALAVAAEPATKALPANLTTILLSVVSVVAVVIAVYFGVTASSLRDGLVAKDVEIAELQAQLSAKETDIAGLLEYRNHIQEQNTKLSQEINELRSAPTSNSFSSTQPAPSGIEELNEYVDAIRNGSRATPSWLEYKSINSAIQNMFRSVKAEEIRQYFDEVYRLKTDLYPLEYFKKKGYTYTDNVIEGWVP